MLIPATLQHVTDQCRHLPIVVSSKMEAAIGHGGMGTCSECAAEAEPMPPTTAGVPRFLQFKPYSTADAFSTGSLLCLSVAPTPSLVFSFFLRTTISRKDCQDVSVLKRSVPKRSFASGSRLRSKTQRSKTRVLGIRLPKGSPKRGCDLGTCVLRR